MERRELCKQVRRLVVKVGSGVLSGGTLCLQEESIQSLAKQIASATARGAQIILVSSGAVMAGLERLERTERPRSIPLKQAAAAVGQSVLMAT
ncbi:MAG: glutamate 5-kinase, partial [Candidatus Methylomirabilales bacterium]